MDYKEGHVQQSKHEEQQQLKNNVTCSSSSSPPSSSSSPSHEFSFTISINPKTKTPDKNTTSTPPFAIDLSPADEIFFHGHLLPLHLLSHLPVSPNSSSNSLDSFTLPIKELSPEQNNNNNDNNNINTDNHCQGDHHVLEDRKLNGKSKSFSLFNIPKWRKTIEEVQKDNRDTQKRRLKSGVNRILKRYMNLMKQIVSFTRRGSNDHQFNRQAYSLSGHLLVKKKKEVRGKRGGFSAPASMRNSPTNSGVLAQSVPNNTSSVANKSDSSMEELQAAIQAAIAHCKKSIATEDKIVKMD